MLTSLRQCNDVSIKKWRREAGLGDARLVGLGMRLPFVWTLGNQACYAFDIHPTQTLTCTVSGNTYTCRTCTVRRHMHCMHTYIRILYCRLRNIENVYTYTHDTYASSKWTESTGNSIIHTVCTEDSTKITYVHTSCIQQSTSV